MNYTRRNLLIIALCTEGAVLVIALVLSWYFDITLFSSVSEPMLDILAGTAAAIIPICLFIFTLSRKANNIPLIGSLRRTMLADVKALFENAGLIDLFFISLLAGISEELLFRGVLQVKYGIILASLLFGLAHFVTPAYAVVAVIMGFYIGYIYQVSGSLLVPVQLHFIYDLSALIYLRYFVTSEAINIDKYR